MRAIFPSIPRLCVYVCVCVGVCIAGVCVCIADGGNKRGRWALLPWGNSTVRCTLRSPAPTLIITFSGLKRIVSVRVCFFFSVKDEFRCHSRNFWALKTLTGDAIFVMRLLICVVELISKAWWILKMTVYRSQTECVHLLHPDFFV